MIVKFQVLMLERGKAFSDVPDSLKEAVRQELIEQGKEHLIGGA